ncbi:MAG TPA: class I SAM-dependent methyltransferase [Acidimicrobiales bacterium]|nr:class I SAM-dependent methyltransferase [Acidimicrobiales bacterium]
METDRRVVRRYELDDEAGRLWRPGVGDLVRLRTWDIFERHLPEQGRIADIGGGPGTHAAHLVNQGYEVVLVDPVQRHIEQARAATGGRATCSLGDARALDLPDASFDAVLLMGPLYHLPERHDRDLALREAHRILKPGGRLVSEVITRHAWILDATGRGLIHDPDVRAGFDVNIGTGLSADPSKLRDGGFWAYFHRVEEAGSEVEAAGFLDLEHIGVEGHAWLLGNLEKLLLQPQQLLEVIRLIESEPALLGMSAHLVTIGTRG